VQIDLDTLPDDPAILQQMLRDAVHQHGALHAENDKLRLLIQRLLRQQFGRRSEQLSPDQLQLGLEDLEQTVAENQAGQEAAEARQGRRRPAPPRRNHGALPEHLPRYEVLIDVERRDCPCCGGALHAIGELRTEQLDIVPAQLRVRVTRRPRYACRACEGAVVVAPAPERPIDGGMATEALIAHVVVSKFCDSLPLYRQAQMLARQGVMLDRSTLSNWVGRACWWLTPLYDLLVGTALSAAKLFADDTTLPVLDPGRGRTKTGRLWCYAVDDRPWCGPGARRPPTSTPRIARARALPGIWRHSAACCRSMAMPGSSGWRATGRWFGPPGVLLGPHAKRPFYEFHASTQSPLAAEVLAQVQALYAIESQIRGHPAEHRRQARQERSRPSSRPCRPGCRPTRAASPPPRTWPRRSAMPAALAGPDGVPRRRPDRDGLERGRARHPPRGPRAQECAVRRERWRGPPLGDRDDAHPDRQAERRRADGLAHRRAGAHRLRANQGHRVGHAVAVELASPAALSRHPLSRHSRRGSTATHRQRKSNCAAAATLTLQGPVGGQQAWLGAGCLLPTPAVSSHGTILHAAAVAADLTADG
jgi:transposase